MSANPILNYGLCPRCAKWHDLWLAVDGSVACPNVVAQQVDSDPEFLAGLRSEWRRSVAEEIAQAIEAEAERLFRERRQGSLGQGLLPAATIARRIGGAS